MCPSPDELIASAALALTDGDGLPVDAGLRAARAALFQGWRAARRGRALPLPVLLDVAAVLATPQHLGLLFRPPIKWEEPVGDYVDWLEELRADLPGHLTARPALHDGESCPQPDYLETLLEDWPGTPEDKRSLQWMLAYDELRNDDDACAQIRARWAGVRNASIHRWKHWCPSVPVVSPDRDRLASTAYWDLFTRLPDRDQLHERFDHDAARTFIDALPPEFLADQEAAIALARRRERLKLDPPTGYDTMNPYCGETTLATLCQGAYGDWKRVNRSDIRISDGDPTQPLWTAEFHVCWPIGCKGLAQTHPGSQIHGQGGTGRVTEASILQGVVALLLDDWRVMLRELPVEFYAHRGPPDLTADSLGPGGERWTARAEGRDQRPPSHVVDRFFERWTWDTAGAQSLGWKTPLAAWGWWCAVLLEGDLPEFGFRRLPAPPPGTGQASAVWRAGGDVLPDCISHLITVVPPDRGGKIFEVLRDRSAHGRDELELRPVARRKGVPQGPDPSFRALRILALDLALDVLHTMGI